MPSSISEAAQYYRKGKFQEAFSGYSDAAEQGDVYAETFVGWMYATGYGTVRNEAEASRWLTSAASKNSSMAQELLGFLSYSKKNYLDAIAWYEKLLHRET